MVRAVDPRSLALGITLRLLPTEQGGRRGPIHDQVLERFGYRPNWGLPSMTPPDQSGAPVIGLSADVVHPGDDAVRAVIVVLAPDMAPRWAAEVTPGTTLPMYEGSRVVGHGTVLWTRPCHAPVTDEERQGFRTWLDEDRPAPLLVRTHHEPAWLPPGSRAEIWRSHEIPRPTGLVRLLLHRDDEVFCLPREDRRLDLPTARAVTGDLDGTVTVRTLAREVLGPSHTVLRPVGFVRNVVADPAADYPWPAPEAHFTVWSAHGEPSRDGVWLPIGAGSPLADRHWFPIVG